MRKSLSVLLLLFLLIVPFPPTPDSTLQAFDGCYSEPITPNTPTGIAGCEVFGIGIASHYAPGNGVAMNFCTWVRRHEGGGCGFVSIAAHDTGLSVVAPVIDFCDCYTGTSNQRTVDLQYTVVDLLGLSLDQGLYPVTVEKINGVQVPQETLGAQASTSRGSINTPTKDETYTLPDTAYGEEDR